MNLYVTLDEIKTSLGITGTSQDAALNQLNKFATAQVNAILGVNDLAFHLEEDEKHDGLGQRVLDLHEMHVTDIIGIDMDGTAYTQDEAYDIDNYRLYLEEYLSGGFRGVLVDYVAGWKPAGWATLAISDNSLITDNMTITIAPGAAGAVVLTEDTEWTTGADAEATAASIAAAVNDHASLGNANDGVGVRAVAVGSTVYLIDKQAQRRTSTVALSVSTGLTLSGGLLNKAIDFPENLRQAVFLYVSNANASRKSPKVRSYTIGSKTVQFASESDFKEFTSLLKPYMRATVRVL